MKKVKKQLNKKKPSEEELWFNKKEGFNIILCLGILAGISFLLASIFALCVLFQGI